MNAQQFEILKKLEGKKVTILKHSEMGFPQTIQCVIEKVECKNYAQYNDLPHIQYKPFKKRTSYVMRVQDYSSMLIFEGYISLKADMFVKETKEANGLIIRESLTCFSDDYFTIAQNSTDKKPIFKQLEIN